MSGTVDQGIAARKVMVIGIGNRDRGDDGIGAIVAEKLMGRLPADVRILARSGDMLSLIDDWAGSDALVCVDATAPMGTPGQIHRIDLADGELPQVLSFPSSHAIGIGEAIGLARMLQLAPRDIVIYAIEGCCFDGGASMTPVVVAAASEAADQVVAEVDRLRRPMKVGFDA